MGTSDFWFIFCTKSVPKGSVKFTQHVVSQKGNLRGLIFLIFAIGIEKFDVKVSFRLEFSYIGLGGGGGRRALIHSAVSSWQIRMLILVVNGTKDDIFDIKQ